MTAKEFLKSKNIWTSMYVSDMSSNEKYFDLSELLEEYANQQLQLGGVVGRSEQLVCPSCESTDIDTEFNHYNLCRNCNIDWEK